MLFIESFMSVKSDFLFLNLFLEQSPKNIFWVAESGILVNTLMIGGFNTFLYSM